jgi:hypothetical protein
MNDQCFVDRRATLAALLQNAADLKDLAAVLLFLGLEVRDGRRRATPRLLGELLLQVHRLRADATRLVERFQESAG